MQAKERATLDLMRKMAQVGSHSATAVIARLCSDFLDFDSERRLSVLAAEQRLSDYARGGVPGPFLEEQMRFGRGAPSASSLPEKAPSDEDPPESPSEKGFLFPGEPFFWDHP